MIMETSDQTKPEPLFSRRDYLLMAVGTTAVATAIVMLSQVILSQLDCAF
jgi:hypothetical protein